MYVLGIHPDGGYFKAALLEEDGKKVKIKFLKEFQREAEEIALLRKKLAKEVPEKEEILVVSALSSKEICIRHVKIPIVAKKAVLKALPFQLESLIPFSKPHKIFPILKKEKKGTLVSLYCYQNEAMQAHLQEISGLGFDPDRVSSVPIALYHFSKMFVRGVKTFFLFHFGWESSLFLGIDDDQVLYSLPIKGGLKNLIDAIKEDAPGIEEIDYLLLEKEIKRRSLVKEEEGKLSEVMREMTNELHRLTIFIERKKDFLSPEGIVLTGYSGVSRHIYSSLEGAHEEIDILPHLEYDKEEILSYAVEIGLALGCVEKDPLSLQLRQNEFISKKERARAKRKVKVFWGASIFSCLTLFCAVSLFFWGNEKRFKNSFNRVIALSGDRVEEYPSINKMFVSSEDYKQATGKLLKKHQKEKGKEDFLQEPRSVAEVLALIFPLLGEDIVMTSFKSTEDKTDLRIQATFVLNKEKERKFFEKLKEVLRSITQEEITIHDKKNAYEVTFIVKA